MKLDQIKELLSRVGWGPHEDSKYTDLYLLSVQKTINDVTYNYSIRKDADVIHFHATSPCEHSKEILITYYFREVSDLCGTEPMILLFDLCLDTFKEFRDMGFEVPDTYRVTTPWAKGNLSFIIREGQDFTLYITKQRESSQVNGETLLDMASGLFEMIEALTSSK